MGYSKSGKISVAPQRNEKKQKFRLSGENYYSTEANEKFFSASQIKSFHECEERTLAEIEGRWERPKTDSLLIGSYVDAAFESKKAFNAFKADHPEIFKRDGTLKAEYARADAMISKAKSDKVFANFMSGRKQVIKTANILGHPFKAKLDVLRIRGDENDRIVDLKTIRDTKPLYKAGEGKLNFVRYWQYDTQMAIYQAVIEKATGKKLPTYLACITKEDPPDILLVEVDQKSIDIELEMLSYKIDRYAGIKAGVIQPTRCENCSYCRATRKLTGPMSLDMLDLLSGGDE